MKMAYAHVPVNLASPHGAELVRLIRQMEAVRTEWTRIRNTMSTMNDGADWSHGETQFGIPTGKGGDVFYMIDVNYSNMHNDESITMSETTMEQCLKQIG